MANTLAKVHTSSIRFPLLWHIKYLLRYFNYSIFAFIAYQVVAKVPRVLDSHFYNIYQVFAKVYKVLDLCCYGISCIWLI